MLVRILIIVAHAVAVLLLLCPGASAATIQLRDISEATGNDSDNDGTWDTLLPGPASVLLAYNGAGPGSFDYNQRAAVEFDLGAVPAGATINNATLLMAFGGYGGAPLQTLQFNGFAGTGTVRLQDFQTQNQVGPLYNASGPDNGAIYYRVPVSAFVQSLSDSGSRYAGFMAENVILNQTILGGSLSANPPLLQLSYTPFPEPSALPLFALLGLLRRRR